MSEINKNRNHSLDGMRTVAITLIVASHTGILGQGGFGNAMFFCLSGFLSSIPFRQDVESTYLSIKEIIKYYFNRIMRIIPTFWVVIAAVYFLTRTFFSGKINFIENMFFIDGYMHLWFLQQQMLMYLMVPFIFLFILLVKKIFKFKYNDILCAAILLLVAFLAHNFLTADIFYLHGRGGPQQFRIGQFLIGMAFGYLYKAYKLSGIDLGKKVIVKGICEALVISFMLFAVVSSEHILKRLDSSFMGYYIGWEAPMLCTLLSGILILSLSIYPQGVFARFMSLRPITYIGEISFIIYLVHMFLIRYLNFGNEITNFMGVYIVSICIACVIQKLVEKPSIIFAKTKSLKAVVDYYKLL